ncbi:MAG: hypothetical protein GY750_19840 [Lentisphaerae bacterium]|nr:hypothetical protein [Lentisphaerota bacterium]MCP4103647.1 hypothetical protein [Lentisphaerota bacterium]
MPEVGVFFGDYVYQVIQLAAWRQKLRSRALAPSPIMSMVCSNIATRSSKASIFFFMIFLLLQLNFSFVY